MKPGYYNDDYDYNPPRGRESYDERYHNPNDRFHERYIRDEQFSNNKYEYRGGKRIKKEKVPSDFSKSVISGIKLTSQVFYIVSITLMVLGLILAYIMFKAKKAFLHDNYIGDTSQLMMLGGAALGLIGSILFLILFIMLFFNRKGWLRKSKSYIPGIISVALLFCASVYVFYMSQGTIANYKTLTGADFIKYSAISSALNDYIYKYLPNIDFLNSSIWNEFWTTKLDVNLWITVIALLVTAMFGSLYVKSLDKTLDESELYFSRRRYYR